MYHTYVCVVHLDDCVLCSRNLAMLDWHQTKLKSGKLRVSATERIRFLFELKSENGNNCSFCDPQFTIWLYFRFFSPSAVISHTKFSGSFYMNRKDFFYLNMSKLNARKKKQKKKFSEFRRHPSICSSFTVIALGHVEYKIAVCRIDFPRAGSAGNACKHSYHSYFVFHEKKKD